MDSWLYVSAGFGLAAAAVILYALGVERRISRLRSRLRSGGRR